MSLDVNILTSTVSTVVSQALQSSLSSNNLATISSQEALQIQARLSGRRRSVRYGGGQEHARYWGRSL